MIRKFDEWMYRRSWRVLVFVSVVLWIAAASLFIWFFGFSPESHTPQETPWEVYIFLTSFALFGAGMTTFAYGTVNRKRVRNKGK